MVRLLLRAYFHEEGYIVQSYLLFHFLKHCYVINALLYCIILSRTLWSLNNTFWYRFFLNEKYVRLMILIVFLIIIVPSYANSHAIQKRETINVYKNISSSGKGTTIRQEKLLNCHTFIEIITSDFRSKLLLPYRLYWLGNTFIRSQWVRNPRRFQQITSIFDAKKE